MTVLKAIRCAVCSIAIGGLGGCVVVIPALPLNAPGYGHTYTVVDQDGNRIAGGLLILHSFYRANEEIFRVYPIENGEARIPAKIGTRCSGLYWLYFPGWTFHFENPYGTYVYPVAPGCLYDGGWQIAPWHGGRLLDGLNPPPKVLRIRRVPSDTEEEALRSLAYEAQIGAQPENDDQRARFRLKEYIEKRRKQLPPSKIALLDEAIRNNDIQEVRRLIDAGADPDFQHLYSLWRPIYEAVIGGHAEIVQLLIERGAQVNVLDATNRSPLFLARDERVRELLLRHGADPKLGDQPTSQPAR